MLFRSKNDDIDIIISSKARKQIFNNSQEFIRLPGGIEIFEPGKSKFMKFGATCDDDLIKKYSFNVNGINFLEPRFYLTRKRRDREKDILDWNGINKFFELQRYKGYPFNELTEDQWSYSK